MITGSILLLLWCVGPSFSKGKARETRLDLYKDRPLLRVMVSNTAQLLCCYKAKGFTAKHSWDLTVSVFNGTKHVLKTNPVVIDEQRVTEETANPSKEGHPCYMLKVREVRMNDTGLYQCRLKPEVEGKHTHGTFLQVYKPMTKFLNISEHSKNVIILMEAILLLLCVLVPGIPLLCKKKKLGEIEKKKKGEEENIYEGLNLEDLDSTYHQIQRSQVRSPYQDVDTLVQDIQLEKP